MKYFLIIISIIQLFSISQNAYSDSITDTYTKGDTLTATLLDNVKAAVNDNDDRVVALETLVSDQQTLITDLQNRLAILESNNVQALNDNVELSPDQNGFLTVRFSGVNLQIVNGVDQVTTNGLGNLVVGYNEMSVAAPAGRPNFCSDGGVRQ